MEKGYTERYIYYSLRNRDEGGEKQTILSGISSVLHSQFVMRSIILIPGNYWTNGEGRGIFSFLDR